LRNLHNAQGAKPLVGVRERGSWIIKAAAAQYVVPEDLCSHSEMVRQMTEAEKWRAIGMVEAGMTIRAVGRQFGRSHTTIRKLLIKSRDTGSVAHASRGNRHYQRSTTARAVRRLLRMVRGRPTLPSTLLRLMWGERSLRGNKSPRAGVNCATCDCRERNCSFAQVDTFQCP